MKKQKHHEETTETIQDNIQAETVETPQNEENNDISQTSEKIEDLTQKCIDLNDKNLRLMAEFDNYRKRTLKERSDLIKTAGENVLGNMLPLVDDFERGLKAMETSEDVVAVKEGVELIYNKFIAFLLQNGIKAIPTENENFDTDLHEAITTFPAPTEEMKGKIVDCVSKGYTLNEKVIRFSKVVVGE
ncbi:MAG: nucleotide exchange factor GrpE [Paludibacter sp.]